MIYSGGGNGSDPNQQLKVLFDKSGVTGIDRTVVFRAACRPAKQVVKLIGKKSIAENYKFPVAGESLRLAA